MGNKVNYLELAYKVLNQWYLEINKSPEDSHIKESFYSLVEQFCKEEEICLDNVAFVAINRYKNAVDLIQGDLADKCDGLPFVKYPYKEDRSKRFIDDLFACKRGNDSISKTEFFSNLFNQEGQIHFLYVPNAELIVYVFIWRILLNKLGGPILGGNYAENSLERVFQEALDDSDYKDQIKCAKEKDQKVVEGLFKDVTFDGNILSAVLEKLKTPSISELSQIVVSQLMKQCTPDSLSGADLNGVFSDVLDGFKNAIVINELLGELHRISPVPIIPYYFQLLFEDFAELEHLVVPLSSSNQYKYTLKDGHRIGISTLLVATRNVSEREKEQKTAERGEIIKKIQYFFSVIALPIIDNYFYGNILRAENLRSAISAIMSRNMSHNLGSHVITNAKYQIEDIANDDSYSEIAPKIRGISCLLQYVQERQDFIAVIANDERYAKGPLNLKSEVFDMLAMDGLSRRHASVAQQTVNYILNNIVKSENVYRRDDQQKGCIDGVEIELQLITKTGEEVYCFSSLGKEQNSEPFKNFIFSIPYGLNGRQALLTIIENIIRNSAKHGKNSLGLLEERRLIFSIIIGEIENDYEVTICDNLCGLELANNAFKNNGIITETGDFCPINILDGDNKVDKRNKGIKEILICLNWMKGVNDYSIIQNRAYELLTIVGVKEARISNAQGNERKRDVTIKPIQEILKKKDHLNEYSLGYRFRVEKYMNSYRIPDSMFRDGRLIHYDRLPSAYLYVVSKEYVPVARKYLTRVIECKRQEQNDFNDLIKVYFGQFLEKKDIGEGYPCLIIQDKDRRYYNDCKEVYSQQIDDKSNAKITDRNHIIYKHHYEVDVEDSGKKSKNEILPLMNENCQFVEGISGGNFTHNLIRTNIDTISYMKITEAALTKIAIVDERIFSKYGGITKVSIPYDRIQNAVDEYMKETEEINGYDKVCSFFKKYTIHLDDDVALKIFGESQREKIIQVLEKYVSNKCRNRIGDYLKDKGIYVMTCNELGELIDLNGQVIHEFRNRKEEIIRFDFFTIHLSLLEKMQNCQEDKRSKKQKLCDVLKKYNILNEIADTKVAVHSGRGGLVDIKDVTFIPLSGIDWAIGDSKFVLSELFYGLKYAPVEEE